ncbi:MAG: hypothetical protein KDA51_00710, partial [Planctomycetales bacterium]|nr:hypothetical protein [Planctomycetales bacterium]
QLNIVPPLDLKPPKLPMQSGEPFVADQLSEQELVVIGWLSSHGYLNAKVVQHVSSRSAGDVVYKTLHYDISPGEQSHIGGLLLHGNFRTSRRLLESELKLSPGEPLNAVAVGEGERRLRDLGVFHAVQIDTFKPEGNSDTWLLAKLQERRVLTVDLITAWSSDDRLTVGAELADRNLFGRGVSLKLDARFGNARGLGPPWLKLGNRDTATINIRVPRPFRLPITFHSQARYDLERKPLFSEEEFSSDVGVERVFLTRDACKRCPEIVGDVSYELSRQKFQGTRLVTNENQTIGRIVNSATVNRTDSPVDPRSGYATEVRLDIALPQLVGPLSSDVGFW